MLLQQVAVILAGFLLVGAIAAVAAHRGLDNMAGNYRRLQELVTQNNAKSAAMTRMRDAIRARMLLTYDIVHTKDPFAADALFQQYGNKALEFINARNALLALKLTRRQRAQIEHQRKLLGSAQKILDSVVDKARMAEVKDAGAMIHRARVANGEVLKELQAMRAEQAQLAKGDLQRATDVYHRSRGSTITLGLFALGLSTLIIGFVVWRIVVQGRALASANRALAEANSDLEHRVDVRTQELMATRAENIRMGAELDVSRRLQRMLLPSAEELDDIHGIDIATFMASAAEVGGDYYDILPHPEGLRIGIGDVTGHGLESGVVMLMAQSAVRTMTPGIGSDVSEQLEAVNHTIYGNVQRMGGGKNLSLAILDYRPVDGAGGRLRIAGQHESVIVARNDGTLEVIDTDPLGFPVGLVESVGQFVGERNVELQSGDVVVLFTDGIPEAADAEHRLYGRDRLCEVVQKSVEMSAAGIQGAIITDVRRHIGDQPLYDDITLIVLRQP